MTFLVETIDRLPTDNAPPLNVTTAGKYDVDQSFVDSAGSLSFETSIINWSLTHYSTIFTLSMGETSFQLDFKQNLHAVQVFADEHDKVVHILAISKNELFRISVPHNWFENVLRGNVGIKSTQIEMLDELQVASFHCPDVDSAIISCTDGTLICVEIVEDDEGKFTISLL
jgi:hypothetical protein